MTRRTRQLRLQLASSAGSALIAALAASGAAAQLAPASTQIEFNQTDVSVTGHDTELSRQDLFGPVNANIDNATAGITQTGSQSGTTNTVTENVVRAAATGNSLTHEIDLALINQGEQDDPLAEPAEGAASLGLQAAVSTVNSTVTNSLLAISQDDFASGAVENAGNAIDATSVSNQAASSIGGTVPTGHASTAEGGSMINYDPSAFVGNLLEASGTLVASTAQSTVGFTSASTLNNSVLIDLSATDDNVVTAAPVLDENTISASATGNSARGTIGVEGGGNPSFDGSAVVTNLQAGRGSTTLANAAASTIAATVESPVGVNTLAGGLSVQDNGITSAATGNESLGQTAGTAGNSIVFDDGMSFYGSGTDAPGASIAYDSGDLSQLVRADLVVSSSQANLGGNVTANTILATIRADVQSIEGGTVAVAGNEIGSDAAGNRASGAVASGEGANAFVGSVAVANQQVADNQTTTSAVTAAMIGSRSGYGLGVTHDAVVTTADNRVGATASGSSSSQSVSLAANIVQTGGGYASLTGGSGPDGNVSAEAGASVTNLQGQYDTDVSASVAGVVLGVVADSSGGGTGPDSQVLNSTLATDSNLVEASASGSAASNALALSGNALDTGAGVVSVQVSDSGSDVQAELADSQIGIFSGTHVGNSTLAATDNVQQVSAAGARVTNRVTVDGSANLAVDTADGPASVITVGLGALPFDSDGASLPQVDAAFALLNDQATQADVSATAGGVETSVQIEGNLVESSAVNEANRALASASGNSADNVVNLALGNVSVGALGGTTPVVASLANAQAIDSQVEAAIEGGTVFRTFVEDDVTQSTVSTSGNIAQVSAYGNNASANRLNVVANNVDTAVGGGTGSVSIGNELVANASFAVQNAQATSGSITASQLQLDGGLDPVAAITVLTQVDGAVSGSTILSNENRLTAGALGNNAVNGVAIEANDLASSAAVRNYQRNHANLLSEIGIPGGEVTLTEPFNYTAALVDGAHDSESNQITGGTFEIDASSLTAAQIESLEADGWTLNGGVLVQSAVGYSATALEYAALIIDGLSGSAIATQTLDLPNDGGVIVRLGDTVGDAITASKVSVTDNLVAGSVIGNSASNSLLVTANSVADGSNGSGSAAGYLGVDGLDMVFGVSAAHSLANVQEMASSAQSLVFGTFAVDAVEGAEITASTLEVEGNVQTSTAAANTASNRIAVEANAVEAGTALRSTQSAPAAILVDAGSQVQLFAPGAVSGSTVSISDNRNQSLAVVNDVANSLTVDAGSIAPVDAAGFAVLDVPMQEIAVATGDHLLVNFQISSGGPVSARAETEIFNEDRELATGLGLVDSSLTIAGNVTSAEATANRATNGVVLNGAALEGASAGLLNTQNALAPVFASATTSATVELAGSIAGGAASGSTIAIEGNSTTALAQGNRALNAVTVTSGSSYGEARGAAAGSTLDGPLPASGEVAAQVALMNHQTSFGPVTASSTNAVHAVALNSGGADAGVLASTVSVSGNQVAAGAYGNSAVNSVVVAALNTGTPTAAVSNYQLNLAPVTATANSVAFGVSAGAGATGASTLGVSGNQVTATAVGNSVTSTIGSAR